MLNKKMKDIILTESINLSQYSVIDSIDKMIELKLKEIELYKKMKESLFIFKLTTESIVYRIEIGSKIYFINETTFNKLNKFNVSDYAKYDIGKIRLKNLVE